MIASAIWQERTTKKPSPNMRESKDGHEMIASAI